MKIVSIFQDMNYFRSKINCEKYVRVATERVKITKYQKFPG